jgi:hypothetical protein
VTRFHSVTASGKAERTLDQWLFVCEYLTIQLYAASEEAFPALKTAQCDDTCSRFESTKAGRMFRGGE